jgi:hypothetical protein
MSRSDLPDFDNTSALLVQTTLTDVPATGYRIMRDCGLELHSRRELARGQSNAMTAENHVNYLIVAVTFVHHHLPGVA